MIDVIIADHQELFHLGVAQILAGANDVRILHQSQSPEQLLRALKTFTPHVLVLSTSFLASFSKIKPVLKPSQTALLVLAEDQQCSLARFQHWLDLRKRCQKTRRQD